MLSHLWESTKWSAHLFYRIGYAISLFGTALVGWLKLFPFIDTWVFKWILPRIGLVALGALVTPLPLWVLVLLMVVPPGLFVGIIFFSFLFALVHF